MGAHKLGKTLFALQLALAYQAGVAFLDSYGVLESPGVLFFEQDDPAGLATLKQVLACAAVRARPDRFFALDRPQFILGRGGCASLRSRSVRETWG